MELQSANGQEKENDVEKQPEKNEKELAAAAENDNKQVEDINQDQNQIYWGNWLEFFLSCIGYAVGYSNVLRFPYVAYKHGGGAFLIPYLISVIFVGIPMLHMELALGQYSRMGPGTLWKNICPMFKGLGFAMLASCIVIVIYFHIVIAWSLFYLYSSFFPILPWASCNGTWNTPICYVSGTNATIVGGLPASIEFLNFEAFRVDVTGVLSYEMVPHLAITLLVGWIITYLAMCMGIESSGKVVYFSATVPYIMLFAILIRAVTLPGAAIGVRQFFVPDWKKLGTLLPWVDALGQVLSAIGIGYGAIITLGSYNHRNNKCNRDALYICTITSCTSIISGLVCFAVLGYLSKLTGIPVSYLIQEDLVLAFVAYPEAIAQLPAAHFWAIAFFFMLLLLGMDSIYGMVEVMITFILRLSRGRLDNKKPIVMGGIAIVLYIIGLLFATRAGLFWLIIVDTSNSGPIVLGLTMFEVLAISLAYGADRLADNVEDMTGSRPNIIWILLWKFVCPLACTFLFIASLATRGTVTYLQRPVPNWAVGIGALISLLVLIWILVGAIHQIIVAPGTFKQKLVKSFSPREEFLKLAYSGKDKNRKPCSANPEAPVLLSHAF